MTQCGKADVAEKVFRWVSAVKQLLSLSEIRKAISVEPGQKSFSHERLVQGMERLPTWCGNLISVTEEGKRVRFAHHSLQLFLPARTLCRLPAIMPRDYRFRLADADTDVGEICITYISFSEFQQQLATIPKPCPAISPLALAGASLASGLKPGIAKLLHRLQSLWQPSRPTEVVSAPLSSAGGLQPAPSLEQQYALLSYAREFWLVHTRQLDPCSPVPPLWKNHVHNTAMMAGGDVPKIAWFIIEYWHYALLRHLARHMDGRIRPLTKSACSALPPSVALFPRSRSPPCRLSLPVRRCRSGTV
jgi:hypothetical protein